LSLLENWDFWKRGKFGIFEIKPWRERVLIFPKVSIEKTDHKNACFCSLIMDFWGGNMKIIY
jgi:hypothetical protein